MGVFVSLREGGPPISTRADCGGAGRRGAISFVWSTCINEPGQTHYLFVCLYLAWPLTFLHSKLLPFHKVRCCSMQAEPGRNEGEF